MKPIGTFVVGLALVSSVPVAQAQTAISRQITREPVETVVTQGPNGTAVTRRILSPEPGATTYVAPPSLYAPVAAGAVESEYYVEPAPAVTTRRYVEPAPALTTRRVTTNRPTTVGVSPRTPERTRTEAAKRVSPRPVRTVTRTVVVAPAPDQALVLSPAQREVIYRSVLRRELYPAPVPAPVVAATDVYAPPPGYPLRTIYPADETYRDYAYDPSYDRDYRDPYHPAYRWDGVQLVVGARIPASLPLYAVPEAVALRIPGAAPYSYAVVDNRVYLVNPATSVIVAEITP